MEKMCLEEKIRILGEVKEKLKEIGFPTMRAPFGDKFKGMESLYELMLWNLTPMEAIAAIIQTEIVRLNYGAVDILANDLEIRLKDLREIIETWIDGELQGRLGKDPGDIARHIHRFVKKRCIIDGDDSIMANELYKEYQEWAKTEEDEPSLSRDQFDEHLRLSFPLTCEKHDENKRKVYIGIGCI
jgi:hypothetical protein